MLTLTIREAMKQEADDSCHYLYVYRDGDVIFYVGRSVSPLDRFMQHMGLRRGMPSSMGSLIRDNAPESYGWLLDIYTLKDCVPIIKKESPYLLDSPDVQFGLEEQSTNFRGDLPPEGLQFLLRKKDIIDTFEYALIRHFKPCLNVVGNRSDSQLPERYNKHPIANKGVIQSSW
jgi:hypothetical protein